jgi:hypothetical protein
MLTSRPSDRNAVCADLDYWLGQWARWMGRTTHRLGLPTRAAVLSTGGASQRWDDWSEGEHDAAIERSCAAIDAILADISTITRDAVHHVYLGARWVYYYPAIVAIAQAEPLLLSAMRKRGVN